MGTLASVKFTASCNSVSTLGIQGKVLKMLIWKYTGQKLPKLTERCLLEEYSVC